MKSKFILFFILISVVFFQEIRVENLEDYFKISQIYNFKLPKKIDGAFDIENPVEYLILSNDNEQKDIVKGLEEVFKFSKVKYDKKPIDTPEKLELKKYEIIILVAENYKGLRKYNYEKIEERVKNGGKLFITIRSQKSPFNKMSGIKSVGDFIETDSFIFEKDIIPGMKNLRPKSNIFGSSGLNLILDKNIDVIGKTKKGIPLMWTYKYGKGEVFYNNSTLFQGKILRGVMKQLISYMCDVSFYPILNSKVLHIDDFPSPIPVLKNKVIQKEYGMETDEFYNTIWWSDMERIFQRERLKITTLAIMVYNDATVKSKIVDINRRTFKDLSKRGREVKVLGGEIGLHGYNHYSLGLANQINYKHYGYTPWGSIKEMEIGLEIAKKNIKKLYGDNFELYTYVGPSNLLTDDGKVALMNVFPEMKAFCGIFYGEMEPGLLLQEVGNDNIYPNVKALPRMSSGFFYSDLVLWQIYNAIGAYGYMSHFIHPDDVIDEERGRGYSWEQLREEFDHIFYDINKEYPVLKPQIQSEMTYDYEVIENIGVQYQVNGDIVNINVDNFVGSFDSHFRAKNKKIKNIVGGEFKLIKKTKEDSFYIVTAKKPQVTIELEEL